MPGPCVERIASFFVMIAIALWKWFWVYKCRECMAMTREQDLTGVGIL